MARDQGMKRGIECVAGSNMANVDSKRQATQLDTTKRERRRMPRYWSNSEDSALKLVIKSLEEGDDIPSHLFWTEVAKFIPNRSAKDCSQRWLQVLNPKIKKGRWTEEEDKKLNELMQRDDTYNNDGKVLWRVVSKEMGTRSSKQCRERWLNQLTPDLNRSAWTHSEDKILLETIKEHPGRWAYIAKKIPGRTENMVKYRYLNLRQSSLNSNAQEVPVEKEKNQKVISQEENTKTNEVEKPQPADITLNASNQSLNDLPEDVVDSIDSLIVNILGSDQTGQLKGQDIDQHVKTEKSEISMDNHKPLILEEYFKYFKMYETSTEQDNMAKSLCRHLEHLDRDC